MSDLNFPYIQYQGDDPYQWGHQHGKDYASAIKELSEIRKELMLEKNPSLKEHLEPLAKKQFDITKKFSPEIARELEGIADGASISLTDLVILNNYTDFRDISLNEEGCSTVHLQKNNNIVSGQTWDMHNSAKNYLCVIHVPKTSFCQESLNLTLVGCTALMGINTSSCLIGVNNINTENAKAGLIWPVLVREVLNSQNISEMEASFKSAPVTSGHNYIISHHDGGAHLEVTPETFEKVSSLNSTEEGFIFHTNHCLGEKAQKIEQATAVNSTTNIRFDLIEKKKDNVNDYESLIALFKDHENYPKSICSHFESGKQDPSMTCGGGVFDITNGRIHFWRGCETYDENYKEYNFELKKEGFVKL